MDGHMQVRLMPGLGENQPLKSKKKESRLAIMARWQPTML